MKKLKMLEEIHTGNQINEELIINNEKINNINADASVRPEHKRNTQKGITLLALIITIIVLLILSAVSVQLITKSEIIEKSKLATLKHEIAQYDEELKLYTIAHREEVNKNPINTSGYENMKKYIPSFKKKYEDKLKISNNKLVYMNDNVSDAERELFNNAGIGSDEMTQIYYLDENNKEQVLEINDAVISETSYTSKSIAKENITKVIIGSSCTKISSDTFNGCTNMTSAIADTSKKITLYQNAFKNCSNLNKLIISNMTYGDRWDLYYICNCTNLTELQLGSQETPMDTVYGYSLSGCSNEKLVIRVYVKDGVTELGNAPFGATNATVELYNTSGNIVGESLGTLYKGDTNIDFEQIPNAEVITAIRNSAFEGCTNLKLTSLPPKLKQIGTKAFKDCSNIKITNIPENVASIGEAAFINCTSLKEVSTSAKTKITLYQNAFRNCSNLNKLIISNMTYGDRWDLYYICNCTNLTELQLGSQEAPMDTVYKYSLSGCSNEKLVIKVYVKDGVTSIGNAPWGAKNATVKYYNATTGEEVK